MRKLGSLFHLCSLLRLASMGPQLYRCGNSEPQRDGKGGDELQWGRNFIIAEIRTAGQACASACQLQWGRNFIVAEIAKATECHHEGRSASMGSQLYRCGNRPHPTRLGWACTWLQWGRNFIVAEICSARPVSGFSSPSFNGAATLSLRKLHMMLDTYLDTHELQWGRNFIVAEIATPADSDRLLLVLQWGRNFIVAEIIHGTRHTDNATSASMGPQLYRCGNMKRQHLLV